MLSFPTIELMQVCGGTSTNAQGAKLAEALAPTVQPELLTPRER